ncbi:MAG: succinate-semialdehyde dehydrogenase (NADP(+)) [Acidimicrobiales bacterium]|nr:succinate-semialdehyde dehydrogenase (NADP(+)) [Acidimicrobiales bacterium]
MARLDQADTAGTVSAELADLAALGSSVRRHELDELTSLVASGGDRPLDPIELTFTGDTLGRVPRCTTDDVTRAVERAREAQAMWARRPLRERARVALRFHDLVLARQREILDIVQLEAGKARRHALEEVLDVAMVARYYSRAADQHLSARRRKGAVPLLTSTIEHHHPKGVVGIIAPWNYPFTLGVSDALPALLAGNGVVIKPDSQTPYSSLWGYALLEEAGLPRGLAQVVAGSGRELGTPLIEGCDYLMFTGSTATGRIVARQAAEQLIDCSMELGGKNALLVLADANLDRTVSGIIRGAYSNAGQLCIAAERIYVEEPVWHTLVPRLVAAVRAMRVGPGLRWDIDMGSLVSASQFATVDAHVADAVGKGAHVLVGGRARPDLGPYFYEPTLLTDVTPRMELFEEETFGPVAAVTKVSSAEEAIERANASRYGLNFSIWTRDTRRGRRLATRLQAGTVNVNEGYAATWASVDAPMGGFKDSGIGRRHGAEGILKYTEAQTVAVQRLLPIAAPPQVDGARFAWLATRALRAARRVPGLK